MKKRLLTLILAMAFVLPTVVVAQPATEKEKFSYAVGFSIAQDIKQGGVDVDVENLVQAIRDVLTGGQLKMTPDAMKAAYEAAIAKQQAALQEEGEKNRAIGQAFLDANKGKPGVVTLPSGLQYKILTEGAGPKPVLGSMVTVHYTGTHTDGTIFDSSHKDGEPITFKLDGLIQAWQDALPMMATGSKWQLFVPPGLGYGPRGSPPIGPNETLVFEIELIEFK